MSALSIPDAAYDAAERAAGRYFDVQSDARDCAADAIHAAAPLVVAAELRRLARDWRLATPVGDGGWLLAAANALERRADELSGGQS